MKQGVPKELQYTCLYTTVQGVWVSKILMFLKEVSYAHKGCIYFINNELLVQFKITVK